MTDPSPFGTVRPIAPSPTHPLADPPWPPDDEAIRAALLAALADGSWGRYDGPHNAQLIAALQDTFQVEHAYPCCSGTFAVELALRMLKVGPGDEVLLAGYDFAGNFRAIEAVGATPVLVDIVPRRWHLNPDQLEAAASPQVKAMIVSHLHGVLAPMRSIVEMAQRHGWSIVEDACQATGALVDSEFAGTWGDVGTLSFGGSKLLTAGRGGAVLTRQAALLQRAKVFCEQGNHAFPLSELQAAVLLPQVATLAIRNEQRRRAVDTLLATFATATGHLAPAARSSDGDEPAYYKLGWLVDLTNDDSQFTRTEQLRNRLAASLQAQGIAIDAGFRGFVKRTSARCRKVGDLRHCSQAAAGTLVLHHPVLLADEDTIRELAQSLREVAAQEADLVK